MKAVSFFKEVKQELLKVKWPSSKEAVIISSLVIAAAAISGLLFLFIDTIIYRFIKMFLGMKG